MQVAYYTTRLPIATWHIHPDLQAGHVHGTRLSAKYAYVGISSSVINTLIKCENFANSASTTASEKLLLDWTDSSNSSVSASRSTSVLLFNVRRQHPWCDTRLEFLYFLYPAEYLVIGCIITSLYHIGRHKQRPSAETYFCKCNECEVPYTKVVFIFV